MSIDQELRLPPTGTSASLEAITSVTPSEYWEELLTPEQAAGFLKQSKNALAVMRCREVGPSYSKCGGLIRYTRRELKKWHDRHLRVPLNEVQS